MNCSATTKINTKKVEWDGLEKKIHLYLYDIIFFLFRLMKCTFMYICNTEVWIERVVSN
jgi:hypothetical protein